MSVAEILRRAGFCPQCPQSVPKAENAVALVALGVPTVPTVPTQNSKGGKRAHLLTASETASIRAWLAHIGETDAGTIADVLQRCRNDAEARSYFIGRAAAELTEPEPDDRRHCRTCQHLSGSRCWATRLLVMDDLPRRCSDYLPMPDDSDQRNGRERWPWLIQKGANDGDH